MNFSFYISGTPHGYNQYPVDKNQSDFIDFAARNTAESMLIIKREGTLSYHYYVRRLHSQGQGFLGFCLVFNGVYCQNPKKLSKLFDDVFYNVLMKGAFVKYEKGRPAYNVRQFTDDVQEIDRVRELFKNSLDRQFLRDFTKILPSFERENGEKTLSINESAKDINGAIRKYDTVYLASNEKAVSELERLQKLLAEVYAEKEALGHKYNSLLAQKKQYKVVAVLSVVILASVIGLYLFKTDLNNKNFEIGSLRREMAVLNDTVSGLHEARSALVSAVKVKDCMIREKDSVVERQQAELQSRENAIGQLQVELSQKDTRIRQAENEARQCRSDANRYRNEAAQSKREAESYKPKTYQVYASGSNRAYRYYRCGNSFTKTDCYYSDFAYVTVYHQQDGYGLTAGGYVRMKDLRTF